MKQLRYLLFLIFILAVMMLGCSAIGDDNGENLQRLSRIDIYSGNGDLLNSITDESSLTQCSDVMAYYAMQNEETEHNDFAKAAETLPVMYNIVFYKTPASHFNDGDLEEELRITMYENSDIVREIISSGNIKNIPVSEEYLTSYFSMSGEDKALFISMVEETISDNLVDEKQNATDHYHFPEADNAIGVSMIATDVSSVGCTLMFSQSGGNVTGELQTGQWYELNVQEDENYDEWLVYDSSGVIAWKDIAYLIKNDDVTEVKVDWEQTHGRLPDGHYRIAQRIMDYRAPGDYDEYYVFAEFDIGGGE